MSHPARQLGISAQLIESPRDVPRVSDDEPAVASVPQEILDAVHARNQERQPARRRLEHDKRERLVRGGQHEGVAGGVGARHVVHPPEGVQPRA